MQVMISITSLPPELNTGVELSSAIPPPTIKEETPKSSEAMLTSRDISSSSTWQEVEITVTPVHIRSASSVAAVPEAAFCEI